MKDQLQKAIKEALSELGLPTEQIELEHPENLEHGDYSTNIALKLKGQNLNVKTTIQKSKLEKSPLELAEEIAKTLNTYPVIHNTCSRLEATAPGFINFWLSPQQLSSELELALACRERYGESEEGKGKRVVVEYSSPNIAKSFGIGHLRSTIIGQTINNLYQKMGHKTIAENHLGDWGTQFGAIIYQVVAKNLAPIKSGLAADTLTVTELEKLYVDFNKEAQDNPDLWEEAKKWFKKLEEGDSQAREIWQACVKVSLAEFERIYERLGVKFDYMHGESFYEDKMPAVIRELKSKKLAVLDQGALIIKFSLGDGMPPGIIQKSDGATTYLTRDLAAVKFRLDTFQPDLIIYEVGVEQTLHFRQLFKIVDMLGWATQDHFIHVKHGLYLGPGGQKFSTRRGETVKIEEVLNEAIEKAKELDIRQEALGNSSETVQEVGIGAIKYFDLLHSPASNIIFDWQKMFLLAGNSGPYLQYTHARARSVLTRAMANDQWPMTNLSFSIGNLVLKGEELVLLRTFYRFPEVIKSAAYQYAPNLLCNFLFDLASKYNNMYNNLSILEAEREEQKNLRLAITAVTVNILKSGLELLGITAPNRM